MADQTLRVLPLGGLGEIGKNMTVVEYDGKLLVVDCGVRFPTAEMVGIDLVLPDFSYLEGRANDIEGIVITHGHEDHLGALPWMLREMSSEGELPPLFGAPLTMAMARSKLDEHKIKEIEIEDVRPGDEIELGPFTVEQIQMTHSIPDAMAVAITTDAGTMLITGDYKFDQTPVDGRPADFGRLAQLGARAQRHGTHKVEIRRLPVLPDIRKIQCNLPNSQAILRAIIKLEIRTALLGNIIKKLKLEIRTHGFVGFIIRV